MSISIVNYTVSMLPRRLSQGCGWLVAGRLAKLAEQELAVDRLAGVWLSIIWLVIGWLVAG